MREIKFRFYSKDAGQYAQVKSVDFGGDFFTVRYLGKNHHIDGMGQLEQFTGLYDKNRKEIYEGDIVFSKDWNPEKQVVTFDRGGFCLKYDGSGYYPDIKYAEQMTVIGNIHENPELLEASC